MSLTRVSASKLTPNEMITLILAKDVEIIRLTEERDEARREICEYQPRYYGPNCVDAEARGAAERRGWDCYKETP